MLNRIKVVLYASTLSLLTLLPISVIAEQATIANAALPKRIQAVYAVTKNGQPFANVQEQFVITDHHYQLESVTKGIGIYALFGERVLSSHGA